MATDKIKEAKEWEDQIRTYQKEKEKAISELRQVRADLRDAARTRLSDLEKEIPILEEKTRILSQSIVDLDKVIEQKKQAYENEYNSMARIFADNEDKLRKSYADKERALNAEKEGYFELREEAIELNRSLNQQQKELAANVKSLNKEREDLEKEKAAFEAGRKIFEKQSDEAMDKIAKGKKENEAKSHELKNNFEALAQNRHEISEKEKELHAGLVKIAEVEKREAACEAKEESNARKEEELNQGRVDLISQRQRNAQREKELIEKENKLNIRENNIKQVEAHLAEKV